MIADDIPLQIVISSGKVRPYVRRLTMTAAYILMQLNATDPRKVMKSIRGVTGVRQAHLLAGPTDCIAFVETANQEALTTTIVALRSVKGVASTDTRVAVPGA